MATQSRFPMALAVLCTLAVVAIGGALAHFTFVDTPMLWSNQEIADGLSVTAVGVDADDELLDKIYHELFQRKDLSLMHAVFTRPQRIGKYSTGEQGRLFDLYADLFLAQLDQAVGPQGLSELERVLPYDDWGRDAFEIALAAASGDVSLRESLSAQIRDVVSKLDSPMAPEWRLLGAAAWVFTDLELLEYTRTRWADTCMAETGHDWDLLRNALDYAPNYLRGEAWTARLCKWYAEELSSCPPLHVANTAQKIYAYNPVPVECQPLFVDYVVDQYGPQAHALAARFLMELQPTPEQLERFNQVANNP